MRNTSQSTRKRSEVPVREQESEWLWEILMVDTISGLDGRRRTHFDLVWQSIIDTEADMFSPRSLADADRRKGNFPVSVSIRGAALILEIIGVTTSTYELRLYLQKTRSGLIADNGMPKDALKAFLRERVFTCGVAATFFQDLEKHYANDGEDFASGSTSPTFFSVNSCDI